MLSSIISQITYLTIYDVFSTIRLRRDSTYYYLYICLIRMCGLEIKNGNVYKMEKKLHIQIYLGHMIQVD